MNAAEREKLAALIESLQGRAKHPVLTTVELMEVIGYLRALEYLAPRLWQTLLALKELKRLALKLGHQYKQAKEIS